MNICARFAMLFMVAGLASFAAADDVLLDAAARKVSDVTEAEDPYLWLETVEDETALDWVRERNARTVAAAHEQPTFAALEADLRAILDSDERIPYVSQHGEHLYNFWRDAEHTRGLWRRTTLAEYRTDNPAWDTVLDLDALAEADGENWVWEGADFLKPSHDRALIDLSRGGADASVTREFDLNTMAFVDDGFERPEAKGGMTWIDRDRVFVFTDFGEVDGQSTLTTSGYPRTVRLLKRGQSLDEAAVVYEGQPEDMYISAGRETRPGSERNFIRRTIAFYNTELFLRLDDGSLEQIDAPNSAAKDVTGERMFLELRDAYTPDGREYAAGSLIAIDFETFRGGGRDFDVLFEPTENSSLSSYSVTRDHVLLNVLEDVKNRVSVLTPGDDGWQRRPLGGAPKIGTVRVRAVDGDTSNDYWMTASGYLTPTTYYRGTIGQSPEQLKQLTPQFIADGLTVTQHFARSDDGTRVPYFMVAPDDWKPDHSHPTLLYGYGGFEISLTPGYNAAVGRAWTGDGGVYVVANIRGGGEYGPRWHQAALKENRLRAYEDFAAVAQDLVARGVTSPERLGIQGGSNGGLLVGNMLTRYPQLFAAAVCQVPLLDMRRYHRLLAGASWMAEYGDPDAPGEWDTIRTYSPYQNVDPAAEYPATLFTTSTRDDRVHPGHARKMMALMESQGHDVRYYENIEGGHGGAANNQQRAFMQALAYTFLREQLFEAAE